MLAELTTVLVSLVRDETRTWDSRVEQPGFARCDDGLEARMDIERYEPGQMERRSAPRRDTVVVVFSLGDLADPGSPRTPADATPHLTPRQSDVLQLLADG